MDSGKLDPVRHSPKKLCVVNAGPAAHLRLEIVGGRISWEHVIGPTANGRNVRKRVKIKGGQQYLWCSHHVVGLDRFFSRKNISFYRKLADKRTNVAKRRQILRLLAEEQIKFKLEFKGLAAE